MRALLILSLASPGPLLAAQICPDVDPNAGYPVAAVTGAAVDASWLSSVAAAVAYRWKVPSRRRNLYAGWERVRARVLPPEPRWADDWKPEERHRASIRLILHRDGRDPAGIILDVSGDKRFDETLLSGLSDPLPASPPFPPIPPSVSDDSVEVVIHFGRVPEVPTVGLIRFAAAQTRAELDRSSLHVAATSRSLGPARRVTVKYDVTSSGGVDGRSIEFLGSISIEAEDAIRGALRSARFTPSTSNCRPIAQTVVQVFGR